jgi:polyhydroxybutyrate depolymerase
MLKPQPFLLDTARTGLLGAIVLALHWIGPAQAQTIGGVPTAAGVHNLQFTDAANPLVGNRSYTLRLPAGYVHGAGTDHRIVLLLHGAGQTVAGFLTRPHIQEFASLADLNGVILVAPEGFGRTWNGAHCCGFAVLLNIDDVAFIENLVDELIGALDIDDHRVHMVGYSNGGVMVHRLAAELPTLFASGATVAGPVGGFLPAALAVPGCEPYVSSCTDWGAVRTPTAPSDPIPVMMIRGMRDDVVVYQGGSRINNLVWHLPAIANTAVLGDTDYTYWTSISGCTDQTIAYYPQGELRECLATAVAQADIRMVSLYGMTHEWPTLTNTAAFDGVQHIVEFLNDHPKP